MLFCYFAPRHHQTLLYYIVLYQTILLQQTSVATEAAARNSGAKSRTMSAAPDERVTATSTGHRHKTVTTAEAAGSATLPVQFTSGQIPNSKLLQNIM